LVVRATDVYGRWSHPITVLTIDYPTAWYHHWWLWIVVLVVIGVAGLLFYRKNWNKQVTTDVQEENDSEETSVVSAADQEFIDKAKAAVSANMINSDYSVDALASDLCMSRSSLHRKMRSITGLTPTDFIRNQRLERAAELLRTTSHSVNEIVDLVGFSYASYFTKCFKEKYGVLPKDY
jgi:AraC-like DNA-binding protein